MKNSESTKNRDVGPGKYQIETTPTHKSFNIRSSSTFRYLFSESTKNNGSAIN